MPDISVLLPVYNDCLYLSEAVESVLAQTFGDFELLIIDDASTDDSLQIAKRYEEQDSRITVLEHEINQGLVEALRTGIVHARGCYLARMDSDDVCLPTRFAKQLQFLRAHPAVSVVGSNVEVFNTTDHSSRVINHPSAPMENHWAMHFYCSLAHPSVMLRKEVLDVESYCTEFKHAEDYDLWTRLLTRGVRLANLDRSVSFCCCFSFRFIILLVDA